MPFHLPRTRAARIGLALFILNELRGVCVVAAYLMATHGRLI